MPGESPWEKRHAHLRPCFTERPYERDGVEGFLGDDFIGDK